jgi:hypothetical protein
MKLPPRRKEKLKRPIAPPGMAWVIRLEATERHAGGYFWGLGFEGIIVRRRLDGQVCRYPSEKHARDASRWLQRKYRINKEYITIELIAHDVEASVWLGTDECPDGMSLEIFAKSGKRFLLIRDDEEEFTTDDIDDNVADAIVRIFDKLNRRLYPRRKGEQDGDK